MSSHVESERTSCNLITVEVKVLLIMRRCVHTEIGNLTCHIIENMKGKIRREKGKPAFFFKINDI